VQTTATRANHNIITANTNHCTGTAFLSIMTLAVDQLNLTNCGNPNNGSKHVSRNFFVSGSTHNITVNIDIVEFLFI
jgi:hypothetical protein